MALRHCQLIRLSYWRDTEVSGIGKPQSLNPTRTVNCLASVTGDFTGAEARNVGQCNLSLILYCIEDEHKAKGVNCHDDTAKQLDWCIHFAGLKLWLNHF